MRTRRAIITPSLLATATAALWILSPGREDSASPKVETRQPRNIYELVYAFEHTFSKILTAEQWDLYQAGGPGEIRRTDPELYDRISKDIRAWTDLWIHHVRTTIVPIPEKRMNAANRKAEQVDGILRGYFETRGWPYKTLRAVFLPPQVFLDERHRENLTSGMFIPFYPDAFFISVDWPVPLELVLMHESLHFNATDSPYGRSMAEGITETGARYLVLKHELLSPYAVRQEEATYPLERKAVELVLEEMMKRKSMSRDEAVELFLGSYLTGNQDGMIEIFGAETWKGVVALSHTRGTWRANRIKDLLEN